MTFPYIDLYAAVARDHHRELIEAAAEARMLRLARRAHPSRGRRHFRPEPPNAA